MNIAFALPKAMAEVVFSEQDRTRLRRLGHSVQEPVEDFSWEQHFDRIRDAGILITGWRTPPMPPEILETLPQLRLIANASAAIRSFLPVAIWERGIRVITSSAALGLGVAEFTLACILFASKRAFWLAKETRKGDWRKSLHCFGGGFELFQCDVGIIGAGQSARYLMKMLAPLECRIRVYDPFVDDAIIESYGAEKLDSLDALFERSRVVSLHAALTKDTKHLLRGSHFRKLRSGAVFVNTARAGIIKEDEFIEALRAENFVACIDVTDEEPPDEQHPFRTLSNVFFTPHIAGAVHQNRWRMGRLVVDEIERFLTGKPLQHEVMINSLYAIA